MALSLTLHLLDVHSCLNALEVNENGERVCYEGGGQAHDSNARQGHGTLAWVYLIREQQWYSWVDQ